eukprot:TRINITY_DN46081_c0_g1_i1.p1 TRINITY_DN46081_c0_g1~~TRINITY_DN46081_c0_g1_i1.p1  ORF type:complete len:465 (+),score=47.56 TRINITY_DN46081_c0_g1_i1:55-1449(+)
MSLLLLTALSLELVRGIRCAKHFESSEQSEVSIASGGANRVRNANPADDSEETYKAITVSGITVVPSKRMQLLRPPLGECYSPNQHLLPAIRLWRERRPDLALLALENILSSKTAHADTMLLARHLMIDIALLHDMYTKILDYAQAVLVFDPQDVRARFIIALYCGCAIETKVKSLQLFNSGNVDKLELSNEWKALNDVRPALAQRLSEIAVDVASAWDAHGQPHDVRQINEVTNTDSWGGSLVISVFGYGPIMENNGHFYPKPPMKQRIDAALKLARAFPHAPILALGGAVQSGKAEGEFIQEELERLDPTLKGRIVVDSRSRDTQGNGRFVAEWIRDNIDGNKTLFIDTSDWDQPRTKLVLYQMFKAMNIDITLVAVGAGAAFNRGHNDPALTERIKREQRAIWRDAARGRQLMSYCDFEGNSVKLVKSKSSGNRRRDAATLAIVVLQLVTLLATFVRISTV